MEKHIINEVTGLYPTEVKSVFVPETTIELENFLRVTRDPISIGGGRFSMGGQIAYPDSVHIDMRKLNKILEFNSEEKWIRIETGTRWQDIQHHIDPYNLSVKVMQTYANFTVGGSLSVNAHGRYIGYGPVIYSVLSIVLIDYKGERIQASPFENKEIFYGAIGGYGGLGIIIEATLSLAVNSKVKLVSKVMEIDDYLEYFKTLTQGEEKVIFHNADLYPNHFSKVRAQSWIETDEPVNNPNRFKYLTRNSYLPEKYFFWSISETFGGKWRREHIIDPLLARGKKICYRNHEASYDVAELEPFTRQFRTYVLQEYFIPVKNILKFSNKLSEIVNRYDVNIINVSIRHAFPDPGSLLAWAREEVFAFVIYYKQRLDVNEKSKVAIWTRELIEAALSCKGSFYLPYQPHATYEQFKRAYPRSDEFFALKSTIDPHYRFKNILWDHYYKPQEPVMPKDSEFLSIMSTKRGQDDVFLFLQNVFNLYPEDKFFNLIKSACEKETSDKAIYEYVQSRLPDIKPFLSELTYMIPSLKHQKEEMHKQTLLLIDDVDKIEGYLEIGSKGRYLSKLDKNIRFKNVYLMDEKAPGYSPSDILERGSILRVGKHLSLNNYKGHITQAIPDESLDLIVCYIGLHHIPEDDLRTFVNFLHRVLRKGGSLLLRDHNAENPYLVEVASIAHTLFNLGLGESWETNSQEYKNFQSLKYWVELLESHGFKKNSYELYQESDPTLNALVRFTKQY